MTKAKRPTKAQRAQGAVRRTGTAKPPPPDPDADLAAWVDVMTTRYVGNAPTQQHAAALRAWIDCADHLARELRAIRRAIQGAA